MHLEPRDAEGHHHIGHGVSLGEQIADLGKRLNVPVGHLVLPHGLLPALGEAALLHLALTDSLHDLEAHLGVQPHGDQVQHDIVAAAHRFQNRGRTADDQVAGVAQPHVGAVGEARQTHQRIKVVRLGVHQHLAGEPGVELRDSHGAGGAQYLVILVPQHLGGGENGHGVRVVQRNLPGVDAGEILHVLDHGGVIVTQHVQLQQVVLHAVVFKMGGNGVAVGVVGGVLHGGEVLHVHVVGHHHQTAGVLAGGAAHTHTALCQTVHLGIGGGLALLLQILLHHAEGGLFRQRTDGARPEHLGLAEHFDGVAVGAGLILAGEVQVDIRHLAAAVAQKRLKGDVKAVLFQPRAALGAVLVGHVCAAAVLGIGLELHVLAVGAVVVGRQRVHLGDAGHIGHQRRAYGATRAHQIAVFQTPLHQLLGGHVHHVVLTQNAGKLHVQPVHDQLGRILAVHGVALGPHHVVQLLLGVFQPGREQLSRRQQLDFLHQIGDFPGVDDDHLAGLFRPQIGEFLQHLVGGLEVDGQRRVSVGEFLAGQQDMTVHLVLRLLKMHVAGGADGLAQLLAQADDGAVEILQLLHRLHVAVAQHEHVVAHRLYLQIVVKAGDALQLRPLPVIRHRPEQLARLAGRADDKPLPVSRQLRLGDGGHPVEVLQVGGGDELVQVLQAQLVLRQNDDVLGETVGLGASGPQLRHFVVDLLDAVDVQLVPHLLEERHQHIGHHARVVAGAVVVEGGQVEIVRHDVQLVLVQLR